MITCKECIEHFKSWGDDPKVKTGRNHLCGCDYCNKPIYYREFEIIKSEIQPVFKLRSRYAEL